jgi:hypothetical protein
VERLQGRHLAGQAEPEVPVLGAGEHPAAPRQQRREVGVLEAGAAADEEQRPQPPQRPQHRLGWRIAEDLFVVADAQHHGIRVLPVAEEVHDARLVAAHHPLDPRPVPPGHRRPARDLLEQPVVVGGGDDRPEACQRLGDRRVARPQLADRLAQPPAVLAARRRSQAAGHTLGHRQQVFEIRRCEVGPQPLRPARGRWRMAHLLAALDACRQQALPRGRAAAARRAPGGRRHRDAGAGDDQHLAGLELGAQVGEHEPST